MAGVDRSNVAVTDTFDTWRIRTNEINTSLNEGTDAITADTIMWRDDTGGYTANVATINTIAVIHDELTSAIAVTSALPADTVKASIYSTGGIHAGAKSIFAADVDVDGVLTAKGNVSLGDDAATDTLVITSTLSSTLTPTTSTAIDLGSATKYFKDAYVQRQYITGSGTASTNTLSIVASAATKTAVSIVQDTITTGSILQISSAATDASERDLVKVTQSGDTSSASLVTVLNLTHASGKGLYIDSTDASADAEYSLEIDADQTTTNAITINAATTTGTGEFHSFPALTTGTGMFITSSSNNLTTGGAVVEVTQTSGTMSAADTSVLSVVQAGSGTTGVKIDTNHATANSSLRIDSTATTKNVVEIVPTAITTGDVFNITTGINSEHIGQLISLTSANTDNTPRGEALKIEYKTANATAVAVRVANSSSDIFTVDQSGDTLVGRDLQVGGNLHVQGTTTQLNTTTTLVKDKTIVLGAVSDVVTDATYSVANPAVVTSTGHGLTNGQFIFVVASTATNIGTVAIQSEMLIKVANKTDDTFQAQTAAGVNINTANESNRIFSWVGPQTDVAVDDAGIYAPGSTAIHSIKWDDTDNYWKLNDSTQIDSTYQFVLPKGDNSATGGGGDKPDHTGGTASDNYPIATQGALRFNEFTDRFEGCHTSPTAQDAGWENLASDGFSMAMAIALG